MSASEGQLGQVVAMMRGWSSAFYFQDQWKVTPNLTINYGLRYELQPGKLLNFKFQRQKMN